ncbi:MAG: 3-methyl-2-oxobutanoate hydroxymethyltransferase, partial [Fibrobacterales bacterium]|nr:3-methyl-2-oxobutanoate hydroxymethyltransferase [Fibrobacterales bacterium]
GARADSLGVDAVVVEHVPDAVGAALARSVAAPVIGIGAGSGTDGQVLVFHDLLGLFEKSPPFAPRFVEGRALLAEGLRRYVEWVKTRGASLRA